MLHVGNYENSYKTMNKHTDWRKSRAVKWWPSHYYLLKHYPQTIDVGLLAVYPRVDAELHAS